MINVNTHDEHDNVRQVFVKAEKHESLKAENQVIDVETIDPAPEPLAASVTGIAAVGP